MLSAVVVIACNGYQCFQYQGYISAYAGQTEQEYLADYLMENKFALSVSSTNLTWKMLQQAAHFPYAGNVQPQQDWLQQAVEKFLQHCEARRIQNLAVN